MAKQFERVKRGDLITADLINSIMEELKMVSASGAVVVPKLFGFSLAQAKSILTDPAVGLVTGDIIATNGDRIYAYNQSALAMVVLNQFPCPGEIVEKGNPVDIVIASKASEGPEPGHKVTAIDPPEGAHVDDIIRVIGENFVSPLYRNRVKFDNEVVFPRAGSSVSSLRVKVPDSLTVPGEFTICVEIDGVSSCLDHTYLIEESSGEPVLDITDTDPKDLVTIGQSLTLIGTGFDPVPGNNQITFIMAGAAGAPPLKHKVFPDSVSPDGEIMTMKINTLGGFPDNMTPSQFGTPFEIEVKVGEQTANFPILIASL